MAAIPKDVKLPFQDFIDIESLWRKFTAGHLSEGDRAAYERIGKSLAAKKDRLRNRQAYFEFKRAGRDDKQAALENYIKTRALSGRSEG